MEGGGLCFTELPIRALWWVQMPMDWGETGGWGHSQISKNKCLCPVPDSDYKHFDI